MSRSTDLFADTVSNEKRLVRKLSKLPIVNLVGVADEAGPFASRFGKQVAWTVKLTFVKWQVDGRDVETRPLELIRPASERQKDRWLTRLDMGSIVRLKARIALTEDASLDGLIESCGRLRPSDMNLLKPAKRKSVSSKMDDAVFGTFKRPLGDDYYEARFDWLKQRVRICLNGECADEFQKSLKSVRRLWRGRNTWDRRIRSYASQELLGLKNKTWLTENELSVTATKFKQRMILRTIAVFPDGSFEFWHDDDDMFWGHGILVRGSMTDGPSEATIVG